MLFTIAAQTNAFRLPLRLSVAALLGLPNSTWIHLGLAQFWVRVSCVFALGIMVGATIAVLLNGYARVARLLQALLLPLAAAGGYAFFFLPVYSSARATGIYSSAIVVAVFIVSRVVHAFDGVPKWPHDSRIRVTATHIAVDHGWWQVVVLASSALAAHDFLFEAPGGSIINAYRVSWQLGLPSAALVAAVILIASGIVAVGVVRLFQAIIVQRYVQRLLLARNNV